MAVVFRILFFVPILFIFAGVTSCRKNYSQHVDTVASSIPAVLASFDFSHAYYKGRVLQKTQSFYEANGFEKMWLEAKRPSNRFKAFASEVAECHVYGMNPDEYKIADLEKEIEKLYDNRKRTEADMSALDMRITATFFMYTTHLLEGRIRNPGAREFIWKRSMPKEDDVSMLLNLKTARDVRKQFESLHPDDTQYEYLQNALIVYNGLEQEDTNFKLLSKTLYLKPGDRHASIPSIRRKLQLTDLTIKKVADTDTLLYDEELAQAVGRFQKRHGLKDDAIISEKTVSFLNMTFGEKAEIIALNLERLRWSPHVTGEGDALVVNVPEYMLRVFHNKKTEMEMRVVLGAEYNATPIFHDTLKYVVFSPT